MRDVLTSRQVGERVVETVALLTSEVVTNALVHAAAAPELVVRLAPGHVRVEVHDAVPAVPFRLMDNAFAPSGRGMAIVEELARDWGIDHVPAGKRVWFEVPVSATG